MHIYNPETLQKFQYDCQKTTRWVALTSYITKAYVYMVEFFFENNQMLTWKIEATTTSTKVENCYRSCVDKLPNIYILWYHFVQKQSKFR